MRTRRGDSRIGPLRLTAQRICKSAWILLLHWTPFRPRTKYFTFSQVLRGSISPSGVGIFSELEEESVLGSRWEPEGCQGPSSVQRRLEKRLLRTVSNWQGDSLHPAKPTLRANSARYLVPCKTVGPMRRAATSFGSSLRSRPTRYFGKDRNRDARVRMPQSRGS